VGGSGLIFTVMTVAIWKAAYWALVIVILLASGGHGFEVLEDLEMIEVKQGPYAGDADKTRFAEVSVHELLVKP